MLEFNQQQKAAVNTTEGPLMILSCAGSGKTTVLLARTRQMIFQGADPRRILLVTFSINAKDELAERFQQQYQIQGVHFNTLHAMAYRIMTRVYGRNAFSVLDPGQISRVYRQLYAQYRHFLTESKTADEIEGEMSLRFAELQLEEYRQQRDYASMDFSQQRHVDFYEIAYAAYKKWKQKEKKIDFTDMLVSAHQIIMTMPGERAFWQQAFTHIMIDEFQDTSDLQAEIFFVMAGKHRNLCVVGDDDQAIYGWRGAAPEVFRTFEKMFPEHKKITLEINYRSLPGIIRSAARLIQYNQQRYPKRFQSARTGEAQITEKNCRNAEHQADFVASEIRRQLAQGRRPEDMAVLARINRELDPVAFRLSREKIPFHTERKTVNACDSRVFRDVEAYWKTAEGNASLEEFRTVLNRSRTFIERNVDQVNLDPAYLAKAAAFGQREEWQIRSSEKAIQRMLQDLKGLQGRPPSSFMDYLKTKTMYPLSLPGLEQYMGEADGFFSMLLDDLAAQSGQFETMAQWIACGKHSAESEKQGMDRRQAAKGRVQLRTFHGAKGMEWKSVYIISANEGICPWEHKGRVRSEEEERRLWYVAMTRAQDDLTVISYDAAGSRDCRKSKYIYEMLGTRPAVPAVLSVPKEAWTVPEDNTAQAQMRRYRKRHPLQHVPDLKDKSNVPKKVQHSPEDRLARLSPGQPVEHAKWGQGVITDLTDRGVATIRFPEKEARILLSVALENGSLKIREP